MKKPQGRIGPRKRILKRFLKEFFLFLAILLVLSGGWFFFRSDLLRIKKLACFLEGEPCSAEIWAGIFDLVADKSIVSFSENFLFRSVKQKYPQVGMIEVRMGFPNKLTVVLTERKPLAQFNFGDWDLSLNEKEGLRERMEVFGKEGEGLGSFWLVDGEGVFFLEEDKKSDLPWVLVKLGKEIELEKGMNLDQFIFGSCLRAFQALREAGFEFESVLIEEEMKLMVIFNSDWEAFFSFDKEIDSQVGSLQLILSRAKIEGRLPRRIDLRFNKPVVDF